MALTGFDPRKVVEFRSKHDTVEPRTCFRIRKTLTEQEEKEIEDSVWESKGFGKKQHQQWKAGTRRWKLLRAIFTGAGCGWDNLNDPEGVAIPFSLESIAFIEDHIKDELLEFVKPAKSEDDDQD